MVELFASFGLAILFSLYIIKIRYGLDKDTKDKMHAIHTHEVTRTGGVAIIASMAIVSLFESQLLVYILITASSIFTFALLEDRFHYDINLNKKVFFIVLSSAMVLLLTKQFAYNLGFATLDENNILHTIFIFLLCLVGIAGVTSAINLIDGLNGYASGTAIITLSFYTAIAMQNGFGELSSLFLIVIGSTLGFFVLNFPFGKIFMGDTGAHILGFILGFGSIILSKIVDGVSLWYPLTALSLPVIETLYSMYRRKYGSRKKKFGPDKEHLHHLVYNAIKQKLKTKENYIVNSASSLILLSVHLLINYLAYLYAEEHVALSIMFVAIFSIYVWCYRRLSTS